MCDQASRKPDIRNVLVASGGHTMITKIMQRRSTNRIATQTYAMYSWRAMGPGH